MNCKHILCVMLLIPTVSTPAIWLRKDPQAIIEGQHNFFFPFLKEENSAIVRNYPQWADEVLAFFADKIKNYPTSASVEGKDPKLVAEAQAILKKEYQQLRAKLRTIHTKNIDLSSLKSCNKKLSPQQREKLYHLLEQTGPQLFGEPLMKIMMVGIQGPKLEDFKRRAHIEDVYAACIKDLNGYKACTQLPQKDKALIQKALAHIDKAYNEVLDAEGLRTATMMESV